jgi:hypothetical protein
MLAEFATLWSELFPAEQARIVQLLVEPVDIQQDALEVRIRVEDLASLVSELRQHEERKRHDPGRRDETGRHDAGRADTDAVPAPWRA